MTRFHEGTSKDFLLISIRIKSEIILFQVHLSHKKTLAIEWHIFFQLPRWLVHYLILLSFKVPVPRPWVNCSFLLYLWLTFWIRDWLLSNRQRGRRRGHRWGRGFDLISIIMIGTIDRVGGEDWRAGFSNCEWRWGKESEEEGKQSNKKERSNINEKVQEWVESTRNESKQERYNGK